MEMISTTEKRQDVLNFLPFWVALICGGVRDDTTILTGNVAGWFHVELFDVV